MYLYSANYLHSGGRKFWYAIDATQNLDFENFVSTNFKDKTPCDYPLRHKWVSINPKRLEENGIKVFRVFLTLKN